MATYYEPPRRRHPLISCLSSLFVLVVLVVAAGAFAAWWFRPQASGIDPNAGPRPIAHRGDLSAFEKANIEIYEKASPSLVQVWNLTESRDMDTLNVQEVPQGTGSGFVWDTDGHIVTNYHVVKNASAAVVTLSDHSSADVQQAWVYPDKDIAVLYIRVAKDKLHPLALGTSRNLKVGELAFALGDPFGLDQTMTMGIISALGREIKSATDRPIRGVIQTSAPINPGNSGGPLLDSAGRLIGMNTAILSPSGTFAGIGFAIPVDEINRIVPQLIRHGKVVRPRLGVQVAEDQLARKLGVEDGALILKVVPDSPAAKAGLEGTTRTKAGKVHLGDVIVEVDGQPVHNSDDLYAAIDPHQVGETVTVTIERNGQRQDVKVTLQVVE